MRAVLIVYAFLAFAGMLLFQDRIVAPMADDLTENLLQATAFNPYR